MKSEKINFKVFLNRFNKIIIPDIQRDYVMGSGGEKLISMLSEMNKCKNEFNYSCIMGYKDEVNNTFYVYDGQQRLATLIYIGAYLLSKEREYNHHEYNELLKRFSFVGRENANNYLQDLLNKGNGELVIEDFTTYSINKLLDCFETRKFLTNYYEANNIDIEFIMNKVYFELVQVQKVGDAEQFFIDLNDGLDLKDYEIFKAELNHKVNDLDKNIFKDFALALDNEWLEFFLKFKSNQCCEEEIEINFIKFCLRMMFIEENEDDVEYNENDIGWIKKEHIERLNTILSNVTDIDINKEDICNCLNYSFGQCFADKHIQKVTGVYWKLDDYDYNSMLKEFILNINKKDEIKNDVLIWCYISNLNGIEEDYLYSYLRFIKKLLNNNRIYNDKVYYTEDGNIWFSKYSTYSIPDYYKIIKLSYVSAEGKNYRYGKSIDLKDNCEEYEKYLLDILKINLYFYKYKNFEALNLLELCKDDKRIINTLISEDGKYKSKDYQQIQRVEDLSYLNGLINNLLDGDRNLMLSYDEIATKVKIDKENNLEHRKAINKIYNEFSYYIDSFEKIMESNLSVSWKAYTGNMSYLSYKVKLVPQCLHDIFAEIRLEEVIKKWVFKKDILINLCNDIQFYLRYYGLIPKQGWIEENMNICYPSDYYAINNYGYRRSSSSGLCSINSITCKPLAKIGNIRENFEKNCYSFKLDINSNIQIKLNNRIISKDDIKGIMTESDLNFVETKLIEKRYNEILFYRDKISNNIILKKCIEEDFSKLKIIKSWIAPRSKIDGGILTILNKGYLLTDNSLKCFINTMKRNRMDCRN
ncbi:DUF262 domain-containing protein [Clostridium botulinum]|uniref:DUF262 domain-containing protein n=1 Tax=Clostridium botulinum TaxID=1491 RepID=UPI001400BE8D|nr:DUF262 domain-containing protein [Clostridium botulinum]MBY6836548.1 DUF262 domain-containing protein [Clostridium botulinum]NFG64171.1 DUF262 domain-containing protein [Clostridium botulinum]NFQ23164.1 DUF262 domain-containing protein [Clostridium botulinum]